MEPTDVKELRGIAIGGVRLDAMTTIAICDEIESLRAKLAEAERERDEALRADNNDAAYVATLIREKRAAIARAERAEAVMIAQVDHDTAERVALLAQVERLTQENAALRAAMPSYEVCTTILRAMAHGDAKLRHRFADAATDAEVFAAIDRIDATRLPAPTVDTASTETTDEMIARHNEVNARLLAEAIEESLWTEEDEEATRLDFVVDAPASEEDRRCEFCGCNTNARLRRCCDAGYKADAVPASDDGEVCPECGGTGNTEHPHDPRVSYPRECAGCCTACNGTGYTSKGDK